MISEKIYSIPAINHQGTIYINYEDINSILKLEELNDSANNNCQARPVSTCDDESIETITQEQLENFCWDRSVKDFKNEIYKLTQKCTAKETRAWKSQANVIGEALKCDYCFKKEEIIKHEEEIIALLQAVSNSTRYLDLMVLNDGRRWSEIRQPISMLMALGNALKLIDFKNSRLEWDELEEQNPEISFNLTRKK